MAKKRLNLALDEGSADALDWLTTETRAKSRTQVLQRALSLYRFVVEEQGKDREIVLKDAEGNEYMIALLFS